MLLFNPALFLVHHVLVHHVKGLLAAGLQVFFSIAFAAFGVANAQMAFPDLTKASGAVKRVFSVIDRVPAILPNLGSGTPTVFHACPELHATVVHHTHCLAMLVTTSVWKLQLT